MVPAITQWASDHHLPQERMQVGGFRRVTDRKLLYHSARCAEQTHLHSLEMCFCDNARCVSCMCIYLKSEAATTPPSNFLHTLSIATHNPEDCIYVLLISISAVPLTVPDTLKSLLDVIE